MPHSNYNSQIHRRGPWRIHLNSHQPSLSHLGKPRPKPRCLRLSCGFAAGLCLATSDAWLWALTAQYLYEGFSGFFLPLGGRYM